MRGITLRNLSHETEAESPPAPGPERRSTRQIAGQLFPSAAERRADADERGRFGVELAGLDFLHDPRMHIDELCEALLRDRACAAFALDVGSELGKQRDITFAARRGHASCWRKLSLTATPHIGVLRASS